LTQVCCAQHPSWFDFMEFYGALPGPKKLVAFSKFGKTHHAAEGMYTPGTFLLFGAETTGLPPEAHEAVVAAGGEVVKIPMSNFEHVRSLNLATSVGVGVFEALRQLDGPVLPENVVQDVRG
jgi:tRNA (cytidine/uridine-2'-O-)-methyltransferase